MNTNEQAYESIVRAIENNQLAEALGQLLAFAQRFSPSKETAVRLQRSEFSTLEQETLMMGETAGLRERRSSLKLQLFRLAEAIRSEAGSATPPEPPRRSYDTAELLVLFRQGQPAELLRRLIALTEGDGPFYNRSLLLEQRWIELRDDEIHHTASQESIALRRNQLNRDLLELIREM